LGLNADPVSAINIKADPDLAENKKFAFLPSMFSMLSINDTSVGDVDVKDKPMWTGTAVIMWLCQCFMKQLEQSASGSVSF
jgi:hypothetical protein